MTRDLYEIIESMPEQQHEEYIPEMPGKRKVSVRKVYSPAYRMSEQMRAMHADPKFAAEHRERGKRHMKRMNRDPKFNEKRIEALRATMDSEEYRERCRAAALKRWAKARGE